MNKTFYEKLKDKYEEVIKDGDFKSIVWDRKKKEFVVTR
jgi:hypothetical protein